MKTLLSIFLIFSIFSFGQEQENRLMDVTPASPMAYSLTRYEAQQPSLYTGTANISIPLHTINFEGWELPLSLCYHASGIKTNQGHIEVEIDWNLSYASIPAATISSIQSYSNLDVDELSEQILITQLNGLRSQFPNALIITYTYNPLVGVTSITDPRGETVYYEYDAFNRLEYVKDSQGNILSKNEYQYKYQ